MVDSSYDENPRAVRGIALQQFNSL